MAQCAEMAFVRGDTLRFQARILSGADPMDLTGFAVQAFIRAEFRGVIHDCDAAVDDAAAGAVSVHVSGAITAAFPSGTGAIQIALRFTAQNGDAFTLPEFPVTVIR